MNADAPIAAIDRPIRIRELRTYALRTTFSRVQRTAKGDRTFSEMLMVEVVTDDGVSGFGEGFTRFGARSYALFIDEVLRPLVVGRDARDMRAIWRDMRASLSGRPGGQIVEAIAAIDIALWDVVGKTLGQPVYRLLGGMGRQRVRAYASSIGWYDPETAEAEVRRVLALGFKEMKVKIGRPVEDAIARIRMVRRVAGDHIMLYADANWAYSVDEAIAVGRVLSDLDYRWFEEPLVSNDRAGYERLSRYLPIQLAAGEADFVATDALERLADRSVGVIQPDVARTGGITETWRITEAAALFHTKFAPHMGSSGMVCAAASLHLAAAAETFFTYECMFGENALRTEICEGAIGEASQLVDGHVPVPQAPGLGIIVKRDALERYAIH